MKLSNYLAVASLLLAVACSTPAPQKQEVDPNYDQAGKQKAVTVTQTTRGAQISSDDRILFDTGKFEVKQDGQVLLDRVA